MLLTIEYLERLKPAYLKKNFPIPKWIVFAETLLRKGWKVKLYRAIHTYSKYLTITKRDKKYKIRFSDHKPSRIKEEEKDCDFFVGRSHNQVCTTEQVLEKILKEEKISCPVCNGTGRVDVLDTDKVTSLTISPPYKEVDCERCSGAGEIEGEEEE